MTSRKTAAKKSSRKTANKTARKTAARRAAPKPTEGETPLPPDSTPSGANPVEEKKKAAPKHNLDADEIQLHWDSVAKGTVRNC